MSLCPNCKKEITFIEKIDMSSYHYKIKPEKDGGFNLDYKYGDSLHGYFCPKCHYFIANYLVDALKLFGNGS